jgi:hypothetical protein
MPATVPPEPWLAVTTLCSMTTRTKPMNGRAPRAPHTTQETEPLRLSDQLEGWLTGEGDKTLGSLVSRFGDKSFASRPRLRFVFHQRFTDIVFGLLAIAGTVGAFLAPPFSGLDTLPALGVVVLSLGVLLEDALIALAGIVLAATGIALELALGAAAFHGLSSIL